MDRTSEPTKRALLIGTERRKRVGVAEDLRLMRDLLLAYGFGADNIACCRGNRVTRQKIIEALETLVTKTRAEDTVVVYYSGHGGIARFDDEIGGRRQPLRQWGYLVCEDKEHSAKNKIFRSILDVELLHYIEHKLGAKTANVTLILECCFAGMFQAPRQRPKTRAADSIKLFHVPDFLQGSRDWMQPSLVPKSSPVIIAATSGSRKSHAKDEGKKPGRFTAELTKVLLGYKEQGRSPIYWGPVIDEVRRKVQTDDDRLYQEAVVVPREREVFGTSELDMAGDFEVIVGSEGGLRLLAGRLHALSQADVLELVAPDHSRSYGTATISEAGLARSTLARTPGGPPLPRAPLRALLRTRTCPTKVALNGDADMVEVLGARVESSAWLALANGADTPTFAVGLEHDVISLSTKNLTFEPRPARLRECLAGDARSPLAGVVADLEALARTPAFAAASRDAKPLPSTVNAQILRNVDGRQRALETCPKLRAGEEFLVVLGQAGERGDTKYVSLVLVSPDGRAYLACDCIDLMNEEPNSARGLEFRAALDWPVDVAEDQGRPASFYFVVSDARIELGSLVAQDPAEPEPERAGSRGVLDRLFESVNVYVRRIDFTLVPEDLSP